MKFVLLAILHLNSGIDQTDVLDYDLTGDDCIAALQQVDVLPISNTEFVCQIQHDLPVDPE